MMFYPELLQAINKKCKELRLVRRWISRYGRRVKDIRRKSNNVKKTYKILWRKWL
jgi:hypothetical protein